MDHDTHSACDTKLFSHNERRTLMTEQPDATASVVDAIRDVAAAVRTLADHAPTDPHRLLRAEDVATLLQVPVRTVRARAAAGAIPHRRFGKHYRFSMSDVEHIVDAMQRPAHHLPTPLPIRGQVAA